MALACVLSGCAPPLLFLPGSKPHADHGLVVLRVSPDNDLAIWLGKLSGVSDLSAYEFRTGEASRYLVLEMLAGRYCFARAAKFDEHMKVVYFDSPHTYPFDVKGNTILYLGDFSFHDSGARLRFSVTYDPRGAIDYLTAEYPDLSKDLPLVIRRGAR